MRGGEGCKKYWKFIIWKKIDPKREEMAAKKLQKLKKCII